jgi:hypothetical protein
MRVESWAGHVQVVGGYFFAATVSGGARNHDRRGYFPFFLL